MKGGKRPGAGRKAGSKTKRSSEVAKRAAAEGITPLEFMLKIMRNDACPDDADVEQRIAFHMARFEAAKAAAPYIHPRLSAAVVKGDESNPIRHRIEVVVVDPANSGPA